MKPGPQGLLDSAAGVCQAWGSYVYSSIEFDSPRYLGVNELIEAWFSNKVA
jgi:hypothetical protein